MLGRVRPSLGSGPVRDRVPAGRSVGLEALGPASALPFDAVFHLEIAMIVSSIEGRDPARWATPSSLGRPVPGPSPLSAGGPRFPQDAVAGHSSAGVVPPGSTPARA